LLLDAQVALQSTLAAKVAELASLERAYADQGSALTMANTSIDALTVDAQRSAASALCTATHASALAASLASAEARADDLTSQLELTTAAMEEGRAVVDALRVDNANLCARVDSLTTALAAAEDSATQCRAECAGLAQEVARLKSQLDAQPAVAASTLEELLTARERAGVLQVSERAALERLREVAEEVGRLAGHRNTRQKIHYMEAVKRENEELRTEVAKLRALAPGGGKAVAVSKALALAPVGGGEKENSAPVAPGSVPAPRGTAAPPHGLRL
jgi:chromosome segregation ATPase